MPKRVKYIGNSDRFFEVAITGKQQGWLRGQSELRDDAEAAQLVASGQFSIVHELALATEGGNLSLKTGLNSISLDNATRLNYNRLPTAEDNANKGYTINSIWQYKGNIYKPTIAPDATSALWARQVKRGGFPADIMGANAKLASGLGVFKAGFTGACVQLSSTVASAPVLTDINILAGGQLDNDAITKVIADADVGTFVTVNRLYDQTGNANHMVFAASAGKITRSLYVVWDTYFNAYMMAADNSYGTSGQGLNFPATLSVREDQISAFFFGRASSSHDNANGVNVASFGTGAAALSIHMNEGAAGVTLAGWRGSSRTPSSANCAPVPVTGACAYYLGSTGNVNIGCNEVNYNFAAADATAYTGGYLGNWDLAFGKFTAMRYFGLCIATTTPATTLQAQNIRHWFYTTYNVLPQVRDRVVFIGDSRGMVVYSDQNANSANIGSAGENIAVQLASDLNSNVEVINASVSGFTNANHATSTIPSLAATYRAGVKNIAIFLVGVNDFIVSNLTAAQSLTNLNTNINALKAVGWKVVVVAELVTNNVTNSANTRLVELSNLINGGGSKADFVVNVLDMTAINTVANYPDGLHPSAPQANLISNRLQPIIDSLLIS